MMYWLTKGLFRLLSWLPLWFLYLISDVVAFLLYRVFKYRMKVVAGNLAIAFPDKTVEERQPIMKQFYKNLADTIVETVKLFSWDAAEIDRRMEGDMSIVNSYLHQEKNVQVISGHFFNWEIANLGISQDCALPFLGVYMPLTNKVLDKVMYEMRSKTGTVLIAATRFRTEVKEHLKKKYALILVADQATAQPAGAYWANFFGKPASFVRGPETGARANNTAIVFINYFKVKRGYYAYTCELITENPAALPEGELTKILVKKVEEAIRKRPDNYLWSHRKWKHEWKPEYGLIN